MFWQEDEQPKSFKVPDNVIDVVFEIRGRELPVDHALGLATALSQWIPQLGNDQRIGVHSVHLASSQNGWERPDPSLGQKLVLSRRTKLTLRVPKADAARIGEALSGAELDVQGCRIQIGGSKQKLLSSEGTIFARYIALEPGEEDDENAFLQRVVDTLLASGIKIKKALCGRTTEIAGPNGPIKTRSVMLAGLQANESIRLQENGFGDLRHLGCGLFIPHKGIDPVQKAND